MATQPRLSGEITLSEPSLEALQESEHRYLELIKALGLPVYTTDAEGRITSYNDAAVEMWGREPDLGVETWCGSFRMYNLDGEHIPHDQCPMAMAVKEDRAIRGQEIVVERPDGSRGTVLPYPTPLHDREGRVVGAVNLVVDVTDRNLGDQASQRLIAIVESSDDVIVSKDLNGIITSWNAAAERIFGYTAEEAIGQSILMIIPEERRHEETEVLSRIRRGERIDHFETIRKRKDGALIDISLTISPVRDRYGRVIGVSKVARDITERKRSETDLADRNRLIDAMTENMSVGLIMLDVQGHIEFMNPAGEVLTGFRIDDVRGRSLHKTMHHHHQDGSEYPEDDCPIVHATLMSETMVEHEDLFVHSDGSFYNILCNVAPVIRDGRRLGTLVDLRDITEWKKADALKDQFLGLISHELRTPLATIYGSSRLLRDRFDRIPTSDRNDLLEDLVGESERLQRIIENLLLMTRLEATGLDLEPLALPLITNRAIEAFSHRNPGREIRLQVEDEVQPVLGNTLYVELVLENLLSNANKYSQPGLAVEVVIKPVSEGADVLVLDRGIGVAGDTESLFTPFFRSQRARGMASGTGVGLAVCRRVIEAQGGSIWARPREGGGTEFGFHLQEAPSSAS